MTLRRLKVIESTESPIEIGVPGSPIPVIEIDDVTGQIMIKGRIVTVDPPAPTVLQHKSVLTNAQIKTDLPAATFEIVPAPGPGKIIVFQQAIIFSHIVEGYTNVGENDIDADKFCVYFVADAQGGYYTVSQYSDLAGWEMFWTVPGDHIAQMVPYIKYRSSELGSPFYGCTSFNGGDWINKPLTLCASNGQREGGPAGGSDENKLTVLVDYSILDVSDIVPAE